MAEKAKASSWVIAVIAIFFLCLIFPRRSWGYIIFFVGVFWACRALFASGSKQAASEVASRASTTRKSTGPAALVTVSPHEAFVRSADFIASAPVPALDPAPAYSPPGATTARFVPDDHPVSAPTPLQTPHAVAPSVSKRFVNDDIPVPVATKAPEQPQTFAIPPAPAQPYDGPGRWIRPGESVVIAGNLINGGMIYVGKDLKAYSRSTDPCLINPALPIAAQANVSEREFGYWPSYSEITPAARRAYLSWLAGGRRDPEADIGYVFLFFYGLERRAIVDGQKDEEAKLDRPAMAQELRRLLSIYGEKNYSFKRYASEFLNWLEVAEVPKALYNRPVPELPTTFEMPFYIRLALGLAAVDGVPVPGHLALAWARLDPASYLRTSATRCAEQFDKLFLQVYADTFKPGIVLPRNKTKLKLVYQAASAGFRGVNEITLTFNETPDVTVLTGPQKQIKKIVDAVSDQLDSYSRYLGRNPEAQNALEGLLLLPPSTWPKSAAEALNDLQVKVSANTMVMTVQELLDLFQAKAALNKERAVALAKKLEASRIGVEPDILGGARTPKPEDYIVLYSTPELSTPPSRTPAYQAASLTLQLASAVASADGDFGEQEMEHLQGQIQAWSHLSPNESARLLAHLRLLAVEPVSLTALKKKLEPLDAKAKETIAAFMATVAQADGTVTPAEVKMLEKVYKALGLDTKKVFTDVHAVASGATPQASISSQAESSGFKLDTAKIAALQKDSERVSALLAGIFKEEAPPPAPAAAHEAEPSETDSPSTGLFGLDEVHSAFARMLLSRPQWTREELLDVSSDLDLMLDGALEHINEVSFDTHDLPFTEGDDPIEVNPEILEKLEA